MGDILIVTDSRGKLLRPLLPAPMGFNIDWEVQNGATLTQAKNLVMHKLANAKYTCVYIIAGICSVTSKDEGIIHLPFESKEEIVDATTRNVKHILKELDDSHVTPIVLCTFPAAELIRVNNKNAIGHHPQQDILNEAIIEINEYIVNLNLDRGFSTPMLSAAVHRCHKRRPDGSQKYRHHYCRLVDGLHPTPSTLTYWCKRLEEDFGQFTFNYEDL